MITIQPERTQLSCGDLLHATVSWQHEQVPSALIVRLQWYTEGRGDTNSGTVDERAFPAAQGPIPPVVQVSLQVPAAGPASYDGRLLRVRWRVEARLDLSWKIDPKERLDLTVHPFVIEDV